MVTRAGAAHVGSCLSVADILAVLYGRALRTDPASPDRDRVILSKGHAAAALYAALAECGWISRHELMTYCQDGSPLTGHVSHHVRGVELSTGSLGHGLSVGCGLALAARRAGAAWRTVVVLSDGELDEGSNWEAILFAGHHQLSNLSAVVDCNGIQSFGRTADVLDLQPLVAKWESFRWRVSEVNGHDHDALTLALSPADDPRPHAVIAHTIKGKGVSFMEDDNLWHYRPPSPEQLSLALAEVAR